MKQFFAFDMLASRQRWLILFSLGLIPAAKNIAAKMNTEEEEAEGALQRLENLAMNIGGRPDSAFTLLQGLVEFSRIQMSIGRRADIATNRLVVLTHWLIALTGALLLLTLVLAVFTIALYKDTRFQIKRESKQEHAALQQSQLPPQP